MGMMRCNSCDTYFDSHDGTDGCEHCLGDGRRWCWMCSRGYEPDEEHPNEADHIKSHFVRSWREEDEDSPDYQ